MAVVPGVDGGAARADIRVVREVPLQARTAAETATRRRDEWRRQATSRDAVVQFQQPRDHRRHTRRRRQPRHAETADVTRQ